MQSENFIAGDKVYHKSDPSTAWVIEFIEKSEAVCSTLNPLTKIKQIESFSVVTLVKIKDTGNGGIITGNSRNRNSW